MKISTFRYENKFQLLTEMALSLVDIFRDLKIRRLRCVMLKSVFIKNIMETSNKETTKKNIIMTSLDKS